MNNIWQLQDAKSKFSEMVERALANGVQIVTRRGQKTVVILPFDEYQRLTKQTDSLVQFLLASPLKSQAWFSSAIRASHATSRSSHELPAGYLCFFRIYPPPAGSTRDGLAEFCG